MKKVLCFLGFFLNTRRHQRKQKRKATIMQLQVSQGHIKINKFICGNCMFNIIIRLSVCRPEKKKKGGHNFYIYIYIYIYIYYTTTTTTSASNPTPPPQKDLLKS
jgi:hypothetical protein